MKRFLYLPAILDLIACGCLLYGSPDLLSSIFVIIMGIVATLGILFGVHPLISCIMGFDLGEESLKRAKAVDSESTWESVNAINTFFGNNYLDDCFDEYRKKVNSQRQLGQVMSDVEDYINEEGISIMSWYNVVNLIPGTLTGLGILGTFIGLIIGIGTVNLDDAASALISVKTLFGGINVAFYTSISGLIISMIFNFSYRLTRNILLREIDLFSENFHKNVIPTVEEQERYRKKREGDKIIRLLSRLPENNRLEEAEETEVSALSPRLIEGLEKGEFEVFYQPVYNLDTKQIVCAEALIRWNHPKLGILKPASFLEAFAKNGYLTKLDTYVWEKVIRKIHTQIEAGQRPIPISVNITRTDLLTIDVANILTHLIKEYDVPPKFVYVEISQQEYMDAEYVVKISENKLINAGFTIVVDHFDGKFASIKSKGLVADYFKLSLHRKDKITESFLRDTITKAEELRIKMVVEGIEDIDDLNMVKDEHYIYGQGLYLKEALKEADFDHLIGG